MRLTRWRSSYAAFPSAPGLRRVLAPRLRVRPAHPRPAFQTPPCVRPRGRPEAPAPAGRRQGERGPDRRQLGGHPCAWRPPWPPGPVANCETEPGKGNTTGSPASTCWINLTGEYRWPRVGSTGDANLVPSRKRPAADRARGDDRAARHRRCRGARPAVPAIDRLEVWPHRPSEQRDPRRALGVFPVGEDAGTAPSCSPRCKRRRNIIRVSASPRPTASAELPPPLRRIRSGCGAGAVGSLGVSR